MSGASKSIVVVGVVLALGAAWWIGSRTGTDSPPVDPADSADSGAAPAGAPALARRAPMATATQDAAREHGAGIEGVVRRGGKPVVAHVEAYRLTSAAPGAPLAWTDPGVGIRKLDPQPDAKPSATTPSDAEGRYRLAGLGRGIYRLAAITPDGARGIATVELGDAGMVSCDLQVPVGAHALRGRVRDVSGKPWKGQVRAFHSWDERSSNQWTPGDAPAVEIDEAGVFSISGLDAGLYLVQAEIPGELRFESEEVWVPQEKDLELTIGVGMHTLKGRVLADEGHAPIEGAMVMGWAGSTWTRAITDAAGRFEILASDTEQTYYLARATGFCLAANYSPVIARELVILLARSGRFEGRVVEKEGGVPVGGVTVLAIRNRGGTGNEMGWSAVTERDGSFGMDDVACAELAVTIASQGWVLAGGTGTTGPVALVLVESSGTARRTLEVVHGVAIEGKVVDGEGHPLSGVHVEIRATDVKGADVAFPGSIGSATTDASGGFKLEGCYPGRSHRVTASAPGFGSSSEDVSAGTAFGTVQVVLDRRAPLTVRVVGERGEPLSVAEISCDDEHVVPGVDGVASLFSACPGRVVVVSAPNRRQFRESLRPLDAAGRIPDVTAVMVEVHGLAGRVTYVDGAPASQIDVALDQPGGSEHTTDADGRFEFEDLPAGEQFLLVRGEPQPSLNLEDDEKPLISRTPARVGDKDVRIVLPWKGPPPETPPAPKILVRIVGPDGIPLPLARIRYEAPEASPKEEQVNGGLVEIPRAFTSLVAYWAGSSSGAKLPLGPARHGPAPQGATEIELRLPPEHRVAGRVLDPVGAPISGAVVIASANGLQEGWARTDDQGRFSIGRLSSGPHRLGVHSMPGLLARSGVEVPEDATDAAIQLARAASFTITVVDGKGAPVDSVPIRIFPAAMVPSPDTSVGEIAKARTDAEGRAVVEGLDPAQRYRLDLGEPLRIDLRGTAVLDVSPVDRTVVLPPAQTITGQVVDLAGIPVGRAAVIWRKDGVMGGAMVLADEQGLFTIDRLEPGRYVLKPSFGFDSVRAREGDEETLESLSHAGSEVPATAGESDVRLKLDPGLPLVVRIEGYREGGNVIVTWRRAEAHSPSTLQWEGSVGATGVVRFLHARKGSLYTVFVGPLSDRMCGYRTDIVPGPEPVVVRLVRGEPIRGRVKCPGPTDDMRVWAERDGARFEPRTNEAGEFLFPALPPGSYRISAVVVTGDARETVWKGSMDAEAGSTVEIVVSK